MPVGRGGRGSPPHVVTEFKWHVEGELRRRNPKERLADAGGAPPLDGTAGTLLYRGWFRRALRTSMVTGALAGLLQAAIVNAALFFLSY